MTVPNHQPAIVWDEEKSPETSDLGQIRDDAEFHCHDNPYLMVKTSHFPSFPSTLRKKGHYLPMKAIVAPLRTSPQVQHRSKSLVKSLPDLGVKSAVNGVVDTMWPPGHN